MGPSDFVPLKLLGKGSFGEVYLVRNVKSEKLHAMKVLFKKRIVKSRLIKYARAERDILTKSSHPFIVKLDYAFQTKTKLFLVMEFCPGGDLGSLILKNGKFSMDKARVYLAEVLLALDDLH